MFLGLQENSRSVFAPVLLSPTREVLYNVSERYMQYFYLLSITSISNRLFLYNQEGAHQRKSPNYRRFPDIYVTHPSLFAKNAVHNQSTRKSLETSF